MPKKQLARQLSLALTALIVLVFLVRAVLIGSKAVWDGATSLVLLLLAWRLGQRFALSTPSLIMAELFLIAHNFGAHGLYDLSLFGLLGYDKVLHFYGPIVLFSIFFNDLKIRKGLAFRHCLAFAALITLGINAIQEVVEFVGNSLLGAGDGLYFYGSGDLGPNNTELDLVANVLGVAVSVLIWAVARGRRT